MPEKQIESFQRKSDEVSFRRCLIARDPAFEPSQEFYRPSKVNIEIQMCEDWSKFKRNAVSKAKEIWEVHNPPSDSDIEEWNLVLIDIWKLGFSGADQPRGRPSIRRRCFSTLTESMGCDFSKTVAMKSCYPGMTQGSLIRILRKEHAISETAARNYARLWQLWHRVWISSSFSKEDMGFAARHDQALVDAAYVYTLKAEQESFLTFRKRISVFFRKHRRRLALAPDVQT